MKGRQRRFVWNVSKRSVIRQTVALLKPSCGENDYVETMQSRQSLIIHVAEVRDHELRIGLHFWITRGQLVAIQYHLFIASPFFTSFYWRLSGSESDSSFTSCAFEPYDLVILNTAVEVSLNISRCLGGSVQSHKGLVILFCVEETKRYRHISCSPRCELCILKSPGRRENRVPKEECFCG